MGAKIAPTAVDRIREQARQLIDQVPDDANWEGLLLEVQMATDHAAGLVAEESNPQSSLRQSIERGLAELDAGQGIDDASIVREFSLPV